MTEDQAKTKTCPTIRYCVNESGVIQDRESAIYVHQLCQGSDCIAWRDIFHHDNGQRFYRPGSGYCGLAGEP